MEGPNGPFNGSVLSDTVVFTEDRIIIGEQYIVTVNYQTDVSSEQLEVTKEIVITSEPIGKFLLAKKASI